MKRNEVDLLRFVGSRIREQRLRVNLTQRALAKSAGISLRHLSAIECSKRNPSLTFLLQIAGVLGMTVAELCEGVDDRPSTRTGSA